MEVTTIKISLKLSKETPTGWRGLEIGAEASISKAESLDSATSRLYGQLRNEFSRLWNQNGIAESEQEAAPEANVAVETKKVVIEDPKQHVAENEEPATEAQIRAIFGKGKAMGLTSKAIKEIAIAAYKVPGIEALTKSQASDFISHLNNRRLPSTW